MSEPEDADSVELEQQWMKDYSISSDQMAEIKETFAMFDSAEAGVIPSDQLGNMLRAMGQCPANKEVDDMVAECTISENGTITLEEVVKAIGARGIKDDMDMKDELEEALKVFDRQGRGCIDASELKTTLQSMGEPIDDDDMKEMCKLAGVDGDGMLNYYDLIQHMCSK